MFTSLGLAKVSILREIYVVAASCGLCVGSAMLKVVQDFAIGCGVTRLRLTTTVNTLAAQRVYEQVSLAIQVQSFANYTSYSTIACSRSSASSSTT
jgi:hypothetical protein